LAILIRLLLAAAKFRACVNGTLHPCQAIETIVTIYLIAISLLGLSGLRQS
jgi:hypothetical protein